MTSTPAYVVFLFFSARTRRIDDTLGTGSVLIACCIRYVIGEERTKNLSTTEQYFTLEKSDGSAGEIYELLRTIGI
jgi:hypothetical protein